jgi:iron complex transport system ATP-binding protein
MLLLENLKAGYDKKIVLKGVDLAFEKGRLYAILGPNGSGKSTLLKIIDRIIEPRDGKIYIDGEDIRKLSLRELAEKLAYLPQHTNSIPNFSVFEAILMGRKPYILFEPTKRDLEVVESLIEELGLQDFAFRKITELSGGEFQKILIARALAQEPKILLLDEPINHLDPKNQIEILQILKRATQKFNLITIIVLHDINLALHFADYLIFMKQGKIYRAEESQEITQELIGEIYDIEVKIVEVEGKRVVIFNTS